MVGIEKMIAKMEPTINKGCTHAVSLIQFHRPPNIFPKNNPIGFI
jgi:hypothetical protein